MVQKEIQSIWKEKGHHKLNVRVKSYAREEG